MKRLFLSGLIVSGLFISPDSAMSQSDAETEAEETTEGSELLQEDELQELVGPVALYPDTLLIQVLVAATYPLEVVKADNMVSDNADTTPEELKPLLEEQGWDESVTVLATAFPDVLNDMATHIEWTETIGNAMLAQSDDVMDAVQDMRQVATETGALTSGEEQTVEVTQDAGDETIIIQPADPEVVYVPQYDPEVVYVEDNNSDVGDFVAAGLVTFGVIALIDNIFDDDDPWNDYWGCRNCGGWHGAPIIRNPDIDIDIDGDVNIGNRPDVGWKPDERRQKEARDEISRKRKPDGATTMPVSKPDRGDQLRSQLSRESGAADISKSRNPAAGIERPAAGVERPDRAREAAVERTRAQPKAQRPAQAGTPQRPQVAQQPRQRAQAAPKRKAAPSGGALERRSASPNRAAAGAARSRGHAGGGRRR
ncbi:MAG: DUF3300 domain-containing protein [Rhodobacteraceae bacterium]|nr:DUF3300 domain-containing protein [Paracoccaceae bacterium]